VLIDHLRREAPILGFDDPVRSAAQTIVDAGLPAVPVAGPGGALHGIFGEREFIEAIFPGYLGQLRYAGFVRGSLDDAIERRSACLAEPVGRHTNTERIDVRVDHSDAQLAETFLHHRVLIVPVVDHDRRVRGIITRADFFTALVRGLGDASSPTPS
jgi:CBS domain-containing protein